MKFLKLAKVTYVAKCFESVKLFTLLVDAFILNVWAFISMFNIILCDSLLSFKYNCHSKTKFNLTGGERNVPKRTKVKYNIMRVYWVSFSLKLFTTVFLGSVWILVHFVGQTSLTFGRYAIEHFFASWCVWVSFTCLF